METGEVEDIEILASTEIGGGFLPDDIVELLLGAVHLYLYKKMEACITPLPKVESVKYISGGALKKWPKRLNAVPPRMISPINKEVSFKAFNRDRSLWAQRVSQYGNIPKSLSMGKYRNIMDMNAGIGGFAAVLSKYPVWVMNVIPYHTNDTLGIIYQRGLIGTYMNWCEAFSTYPRTYDLIHADGIFSMYMDRCDILDIFLEMHRILQPEGTVIIRDHIDILVKAKGIMGQMGWNGTMQHSERGPSHPEKVLIIDNSK
ncbi:hypothetical protein GIB67_022345 [Kingdonia uniflora]|uniref:Methyltransferase n=1 Tax=Kingdonia uniflora TaxID=39325 RepID=A0A7J7N6B8_9MAGN|nr:hypothetical protein GIB67_022345 [Kingdonia uniflora]